MVKVPAAVVIARLSVQTSLPPTPVARQPHATHCQGCGTSGCLARGRWGRRAGRSGWRRTGAASARRPPGVGSCAVSGDRPGSWRRRGPVPAAATPGPATGGSAWPRRPPSARFCLPEQVRGSAIAESGAERPTGAAPAGPMGSLGAGTGRGDGRGARAQWARGGAAGAGEPAGASARVCPARSGGRCVSVNHRVGLQGLRGVSVRQAGHRDREIDRDRDRNRET